ncbi:iron-sulfur cluster assembly scaffold protein [Haloarcula sp. S1CR25-12]|uniref:Iron-sulfur cluster assembly scaffold protein n=1 Tax=Haloarcula saliterrae TaxID=2950534 RepID=A0ABU2FGM8_9EURY|nr:iron-sulfur cluster assembly scaffold protein [Haloarcula sp. S1CR25-12]MDS0260995.1 iron-sulfur cluster assembly scaffold protein [Haloarcula sp. S1CR25-12]
MQGSSMYQEVILDHYRNPRRWGRLSSVTFSHTGENSSCGDELTFDLRLAEDGETIDEVAFTGEGCAISIASASLLAEELPGMTLSKVRDLDREDALDLLGIEPTPMRVPCAVLAEKVVQDGVESYEDDE